MLALLVPKKLAHLIKNLEKMKLKVLQLSRCKSQNMAVKRGVTTMCFAVLESFTCEKIPMSHVEDNKYEDECAEMICMLKQK